MRLLPDRHAAVFQLLTRANGLIDRQTNALATDRAGNIWAGTPGAGVMKIQPAGLTTFGEQDGLATDRLTSVLADRTGAVLAVTVSTTTVKHSVNIFDGVGFRNVVPKVFGNYASWESNQILIQSRSGEWWAATRIGLCRFPPVKGGGTCPDAAYGVLRAR